MGAGILPIAIFNNKIYFLFSREQNSYNSNHNQWSDFGGRKEKNETYKETAIREGWEESDGFLGDISDITDLINNKTVAIITSKGYRTYIVKINYDKNLPELFQNKFQEIKKNNPELISKNGFYEKDKLRWIEHNNIKKYMNFYRPWYKAFAKEISRLSF